MRGDSFDAVLERGRDLGSSPRAWGQRLVQQCLDALRRFIPTCVGTATSSRASRPSRAVHPHVRGDSDRNGVYVGHVGGSSPRAWGQLSERLDRGRRARFIPTCVGTASASRSPWSAPAVHPHVRGDSLQVHEAEGDHLGSSPRAWGQPRRWTRVARLSRFIPTCVGTAVCAARCRRRSTVHPHVRGDSVRGEPQAGRSAGSSPRAWGQRSRCAGAHRSNGSSPRAWGQRFARRGRWARERFIPTCVGTASAGNARAPGRSVHPHVRGDSVSLSAVTVTVRGSSPRAWGQQLHRGRRRPRPRFIPTCVGTA